MQRLINVYSKFDAAIASLTPWVDISVRLYIAWIFFKSGLLKIQSWPSTLELFQYEYTVPLISPELAAYLGTAAELTLPVMVAIGLAGRPAALGLFVFNIIAVVSYPDLSETGRQFHLLWGMLLAMLMTHGPGCLSLDTLIAKMCTRCTGPADGAR